MRIITVTGSLKSGEPPRRKGVETGDIAKDGYTVTARAVDDYRKDMRRGSYMSPSRNQIFDTCNDQDEDD